MIPDQYGMDKNGFTEYNIDYNMNKKTLIFGILIGILTTIFLAVGIINLINHQKYYELQKQVSGNTADIQKIVDFINKATQPK